MIHFAPLLGTLLRAHRSWRRLALCGRPVPGSILLHDIGSRAAAEPLDLGCEDASCCAACFADAVPRSKAGLREGLRRTAAATPKAADENDVLRLHDVRVIRLRL